jgi:hypothetical protein
MSTLVAVVFNDETTAFEMRTALLKMQTEYLIEMEDSVVVTKNQQGKVRLDQIVNLTSAGAVGGDDKAGGAAATADGLAQAIRDGRVSQRAAAYFARAGR